MDSDTGHYLKKVHTENFPLGRGEPDPEAKNNVVRLQKLCYKNQIVSITVT